jgi:hypothetical protein
MPKRQDNQQHRAVLRTLKQYRGKAVDILNDEPIDVYLFLQDRFDSSDNVRRDYVFQFLFRSYYRMDNAGLSDDFKTAYFDLLEMKRGSTDLDLKDICAELSRYKTKRQKQSLQFSFATKLAATVNVWHPIYDSLVAAVFEFRHPSHIKDFDKRLGRLVEFYGTLRETVTWLAHQEDFFEISRAVAKKVTNWSRVPKIKKVDFILWATGKAINQR